MSDRRRRTLVIRDAGKLRALRTPLRREILETLMRLRTASVKDLARELGRAPAALYYHVHELARVGLVREVEKRPAGKRLESVYEPVASRIKIDRTVRKRRFIEALLDLQRSTLRAAERELARALESGRVTGASTSLFRASARLRPKAAGRARKMLAELVRFIAENDDPDAADTYAITAALVPVERRTPGD